MRPSLSRILLVSLLALIGPRTVRADESVEDREFQIKAGFLYNFGLFVHWPGEAARGDFVIGVFGDSSVVPFLQQIADRKTIGDRKIVIQRFAAIEDYKPCQILFLPRDAGAKEALPADKRLAAARKRIGNAPVLLVTSGEGLAEKGANISFFVEDNRMRFEINPDAAKRSGLQVSSKLLTIGKIVHTADK